MQEHLLNSIDEYNRFVVDNPGAVIYFSTNECSVCKVLKPKLKSFLENDYSEMAFAYVNINETKDVSAANQVFTVPTILFYFDGKEFIRKSRNINMATLSQGLDRLYSMMFG